MCNSPTVANHLLRFVALKYLMIARSTSKDLSTRFGNCKPSKKIPLLWRCKICPLVFHGTASFLIFIISAFAFFLLQSESLVCTDPSFQSIITFRLGCELNFDAVNVNYNCSAQLNLANSEQVSNCSSNKPITRAQTN